MPLRFPLLSLVLVPLLSGVTWSATVGADHDVDADLAAVRTTALKTFKE
ncbi:MAG TPA: hypothetical protein VHX44_09950 [Planctomycetota bacterium]|nr:hypothetical protein [Planctomycetota bacterium]